MWRRLRELSPRTTLIAGFVVFLLYAYPGYMSTDSVQQLRQARLAHFIDGHPPLMGMEWLVLDKIVAGPLLMLLLQGALFLGGLYYLLRRFTSPRPAAWLAIGVLLYPPVLTVMAVVWKDTEMAAFLVAGTAALLSPRLRMRVAGLGLLAAACAVRYNALVAAVPIAVILFEWRRPIRWWKRIGIFFAACLVAGGAAFGISRVVAAEHVRLTPAFYDIVSVLACTRDRDDADLRNVLRGTPLVSDIGIQLDARRLHLLEGSWRIVSSDQRMFFYPDSEAQWSAINRAWKELILDDPAAYMQCHWDDFSRIIGLSEATRASVWNGFLEAPEQRDTIDHDAYPSGLQQWLGLKFDLIADHTPLFRPYIYAVIALLLLVLCCRDRVTFALFASGLAYEASFFPVGADPDYRYSHWMITATCIAAVILSLIRAHPRQEAVAGHQRVPNAEAPHHPV